MNISKIFIERPIMTTLVMIAILFFGIFAYKALPVSDLPDVEFPAITVTTNYPGASPETIANNVSTPLEQAFLTIGGLKNIISTSSTGSSSIVLQFAIDRSIDAAAQDVQAAINQATPHLPQDLPFAPTYQKVNPSQTPIVWFAISSATMPSYQLYDYAYSFIGERISTIDGVAQVVVFGSPFAVRVQVDPLKLAAKGIGLEDVASALKSQNVNIPTGNLYGKHTEFFINVDGQLSKAAAYNSIIIKNEDGAIVRLQDIGQALDSLSNDKQYLRFISSEKDLNTVVFGVRTQAGTNSMTVIENINTILPHLESALPGSVHLRRVFDKSIFIEESVVDVQSTLLIAFLLVVLVVFFYLGKAKNTLIPMLALPISVIGTFIVMSVIGYTIDILSLLAITLCIGFLVDDAIVVLENIVRHVEMGKSALQSALDGSKEISFTILSMTLSLASIFIPLLFMGGSSEGSFMNLQSSF
jgi:HAE1 family hydrophobic/amphiphilic exporter-1